MTNKKKQSFSYSQALHYALRLLQQRSYSEHGLRQKLTQHLVSLDDQNRVLVRLKELDLVDDARFAQSLARTESEYRNRSNKQISQKLFAKGIDRELIDTSLRRLGEDAKSELERAQYHAQRYVTAYKRKAGTDYDRRDLQQRVYAHLQRRGFSYSVIKQATELYLR